MPDLTRQKLGCEEAAHLDFIPLFANLTSAALNQIVENPRPVKIERYVYLFHQGQPTTSVHVILCGWIKLCRMDKSGVERIIRIAGPGEMLGYDDLLLKSFHQISAEAVSKVCTLMLDGKRLLRLIRRDPETAARFAAHLAEQIQVLTRHVEELKRLDTLQRTAQFLLNLCPGQIGTCSITLPFEKAAIAGFLGMKPASFSRTLACLRSFGVSIDRNSVVITDTRLLSALVQASPPIPPR